MEGNEGVLGYFWREKWEGNEEVPWFSLQKYLLEGNFGGKKWRVEMGFDGGCRVVMEGIVGTKIK